MNRVPQYVQDFPWDLIVFHDLFVCSRWTRSLFLEQVEKVQCFRNSDAVKVVIPQDEFISTDLICDLINDFGISHVFSCADASEWQKIYRTVNFKKVQFTQVLTGYIDERIKRRILWYSLKQAGKRKIDIGYRTHPVPYWLGRHAMLKWQMAPIFAQAMNGTGLVSDISYAESDTITGDDWFKFLLDCKYQLGIEGGASILDWDGTYQSLTDVYLKENPSASFEEVESHCFPSADGSLKLFALSPRHLECAVTRTCQVLIEGDYNGILKPWRHYIPVKKDLSNVGEMLAVVKDDLLREPIVERVWKEIVEPGGYTYKKFADLILDTSLAGGHLNKVDMAKGQMMKARMATMDWFSWKAVQAQYGLARRKKWFVETVMAKNK